MNNERKDFEILAIKLLFKRIGEGARIGAYLGSHSLSIIMKALDALYAQ